MMFKTERYLYACKDRQKDGVKFKYIYLNFFAANKNFNCPLKEETKKEN